jgi:hypothetical protein
MKIEKKQVQTKSKFNLEKMRVAQLHNLHLINGGASTIDVQGGDDGTITQGHKTVFTLTF